MNLRDARAIDQHIDFDCHHKQLNLSFSASIEAFIANQRHRQTPSNWMQGRQRSVSQHVISLHVKMWFFSFLSSTRVSIQYFTMHETALKLTWSWPCPCEDFSVQDPYNCFDMPLSNISAPWPAARLRQQGYNPSVEPSLSQSAHPVGRLWKVCRYGCFYWISFI